MRLRILAAKEADTFYVEGQGGGPPERRIPWTRVEADPPKSKAPPAARALVRFGRRVIASVRGSGGTTLTMRMALMCRGRRISRSKIGAADARHGRIAAASVNLYVHPSLQPPRAGDKDLTRTYIASLKLYDEALNAEGTPCYGPIAPLHSCDCFGA